MNYDLARELRDAGFPQMGDGDALILHNRKDPENDQTMSVIPWAIYVYHPQKGKEVMYAPSLSELIEACGESFEALTMEHSHQGNGWNAIAFYGGRHGHGGSPEEAVARLWLAMKCVGVHIASEDNAAVGSME